MKEVSGLNNVQRKMLDDIYMEQFDKIEREILEPIKRDFEKLKETVLREEIKKSPIKELYLALEKAHKLYKKNENYLNDNDMAFKEGYGYKKEPVLEFGYGYVRHPKIVAFHKKAKEKELELANKRKEIRARIYGLNTTYEEVSKEISAYLSSIKL